MGWKAESLTDLVFAHEREERMRVRQKQSYIAAQRTTHGFYSSISLNTSGTPKPTPSKHHPPPFLPPHTYLYILYHFYHKLVELLTLISCTQTTIPCHPYLTLKQIHSSQKGEVASSHSPSFCETHNPVPISYAILFSRFEYRA